MRVLALAFAAATLGATAAVAQVPVRAVAPDLSYDRTETTLGMISVEPDPARPAYRSNSEAVFDSSAKGGNAEQTNRLVPNLGATSGGPVF